MQEPLRGEVQQDIIGVWIGHASHQEGCLAALNSMHIHLAAQETLLLGPGIVWQQWWPGLFLTV